MYNSMVIGLAETEDADHLFHALADGTRREILALVLTGEHSVSDLARRFPISFAAVHKHVTVLERAGLVTKQRQGREQRVSGQVDRLREARRLLDDLETVWRERIGRISALLAEPPSDSPPPDSLPAR
jgi:DNA-binding transcriptional ArsR family regulator